MPKLTWSDLEDIALALYDKFPGQDPSFIRFTDSGATFNFGWWFTVTVYPRNFRFQGRATALFSRFTVRRRRFFRNASTDVSTRSPAASDFT